MLQSQKDNQRARRAWSTNARFWDEHILDIACGNGVTSRRLAQAGACVTAFDFSAEMISLARKRGDSPNVEYRVADATDGSALLECGVGKFDAALCTMALMDLADIGPWMKALGSLLPASHVGDSRAHDR